MLSDLTTDQKVPEKARQSISFSELISFAMPTVGAGYMFCLVSLYLMKFATDVFAAATVEVTEFKCGPPFAANKNGNNDLPLYSTGIFSCPHINSIIVGAISTDSVYYFRHETYHC